MNDLAFDRWLLQTSEVWKDVESTIKKLEVPGIDLVNQHLVELLMDLNGVSKNVKNNKFDIDLLEKELSILNDLKNFFILTKFEYDQLADDLSLENKWILAQSGTNILAVIQKLINYCHQGKIRLSQELKVELIDGVVNYINHQCVLSFAKENFLKSNINSFWNEAAEEIGENKKNVNISQESFRKALDSSKEDFLAFFVLPETDFQKNFQKIALEIKSYSDFEKIMEEVNSLEKRINESNPESNLKEIILLIYRKKILNWAEQVKESVLSGDIDFDLICANHLFQWYRISLSLSIYLNKGNLSLTEKGKENV